MYIVSTFIDDIFWKVKTEEEAKEITQKVTDLFTQHPFENGQYVVRDGRAGYAPWVEQKINFGEIASYEEL